MADSIDASVMLPVINRIYDAALNASVWPEVVERIALLHASERAILFTPLHAPQQGGIYFAAGISESMIQLRVAKYGQYDVWLQAIQEKGYFRESTVITDEDLIPHEELLKTEFYREFLSKQDLARLCCGIVFGVDSTGMPPTGLSIFRGLADAPFGTYEREVYAILIPHISRALGIMFRLRDAELKVAATLAGFDRLASGVILLGNQGNVIFANRAARRVLQLEDGLRLRAAAQGRTFLAANAMDDQRALNAAIKQCTEPDGVVVPHFSNALRINRPSGLAAYTLNVSALPEQNEFGAGADRPCAIGFLNDPQEPVKVEAEVLNRLYGLTAAECRLAAHLCEGEALSVIAKRLKVSESTVKTQLQSIFDKTQTRRQVQLVKLLISLASSAV
jgi:DNA-binding CsgD family transcriptional regulator